MPTARAKVIFQKIRTVSRGAGAKMGDVVNMTIFVVDMADNKGIWRAPGVLQGRLPVLDADRIRVWPNPEIKLEIQCQAVAGASRKTPASRSIHEA